MPAKYCYTNVGAVYNHLKYREKTFIINNKKILLLTNATYVYNEKPV